MASQPPLSSENKCYPLKISIVVATALILMTCTTSDNSLIEGDFDQGGLSVPKGFAVLVVADSVGRARHLTVRDNGDIYVKLNGSNKVRGSVVGLRDHDGDGRADQIERFGGLEGESRNYGAGMIIHNDYLYFSSATRVFRYKLTSALVPSSPLEIVLEDDHDHGTHWHITKPVSFDEKGYMYIPFGTPSNACQDLDGTPNGAMGGVGLDPCPELVLHGGIWRFPADEINLRQSDGVRIATGIRSVVAMDWHKDDNHLYIVMHGRDNLYSLYPDRYTPWESAVLPAEEFIRIEEGADYGWPYCYYDQMKEEKVLAPEYGGDGEKIGRCADMAKPIMGFPGHWAPNDLLFYEGDQFPERYRNGAFIAFHGSTNRSPYPQAGYFVGFVPMRDGRPLGPVEVFADGFAGVDTIVNTSDAASRPMGLAEGADGSLYIIESNQGRIWRIQFTGNRQEFGADDLAEMEARKKLPHIRTPHPDNDHLEKHLEESARLYNTFCGTCHQRDGQGVKGRFPPLVRTDWVLDKEKLIEVTLRGMSGSLEVDGESYNSVMPPHAFLSDDQLASILSYVRNRFGEGAHDVLPEEVAMRREKSVMD